MNPGFSFIALRSAPSLHWLPWAPAATGLGLSASEPLAVGAWLWVLGVPLLTTQQGVPAESQQLGSDSGPTVGHPSHSPVSPLKVPSPQHPDSSARCLLIFIPQVFSTACDSSDGSLGGVGGGQLCQKGRLKTVTAITLQGQGQFRTQAPHPNCCIFSTLGDFFLCLGG